MVSPLRCRANIPATVSTPTPTDQGFSGYTTFDLGVGYDFGAIGLLKHAKLSLNVTNLTNKRYAANFDNSVFAPTDPTGSIIVAHSSAPRQFFGTISTAF